MADDPKDDAEVERPSPDTLIESWLEKHGEEKTTKAGVPYWEIRSQDYKDALSSFLNSYLYAGYTESDARSSLLLKQIQDALTKEIKNSQKLASWRGIVADVWKWVIAKQFANKDLIKPATNYKAEAAAKAAEKAKEKADKEDTAEPYIAPESKLDPDKFEGYGDAQVIYDEEVAKMFEDLKKNE